MGAVTTMIPAWFRTQMSRLLGLKFAPADLTTHWEALSDVPVSVLEAAVTRAQKTRVDFPTPVELRTDADAVAHMVRASAPAEDRATALPEPFTIQVPQAGTVVSVTREWRYYCEQCSDSGWYSLWCGARAVAISEQATREIAKPWQESRPCDRRGEHGAHEWVSRCACYDTNPALVRKREAAQKYAEKPK